MWDSELYVLPAVLPFHPELAKRMLRYRTMLFEQALANAEERGEVGARWVLWRWCCVNVNAYEDAEVHGDIHIGGTR